MWPRTEALLSAADRQPDRPSWFKSWEVGILSEGARTICERVYERKQVSLYLMSLDQSANRTGGGWMENSSTIIGTLYRIEPQRENIYIWKPHFTTSSNSFPRFD